MPIATSDFDIIRQLVYRRAAIVLEPGKEYLVESRMGTVLRRHRLDSISDLVLSLHGPTARAMEDEIVDAMTTNETSFFRDHHPFDTLRKDVLPEIIARKAASRTLDIWCGASSSGQEPYSIAMTLKEGFGAQIAGWRVKILATDICQEMLDKAKHGAYSELEINRGLPAPLMVKYFQRVGLQWQLKPEVREMVEFRKLNLVGPWGALPSFDVVFLRNVLIYFDTDTKRKILAQIRQSMAPHAMLFLGGAETVINFAEDFEIVRLGRTVVYRVR